MNNYFEIMDMEQNAVYNLDAIKNKKVKEFTVELIKNINGHNISELKGYNFLISNANTSYRSIKSFFKIYVFKEGKLVYTDNIMITSKCNFNDRLFGMGGYVERFNSRIKMGEELGYIDETEYELKIKEEKELIKNYVYDLKGLNRIIYNTLLCNSRFDII